MKLEGRVAIVTGASAGIGRAYALALAAEGATVVAAARRLGDLHGGSDGDHTLATLVQESAPLAGRVHACRCDMECEADIVSMVRHTAVNYRRLDVLVNNAAFLWQIDALAVGGDEWDRMMALNVRGPYVAIREAARYMQPQKSGSIINITAGAGNMSERANYPRMLPYAVSKAALNRLSLFMATELRADGIAVNCLSPGVVLSEAALQANPEVASAGTHKPATPEVLGPALVYLAMQTADTLTGQVLHTDEFGRSWP